MADKDDEKEDEGVGEEAARMINAFGDEVDKRVNKILDERLRVNEEKKEEGSEGEKEGEEEKKAEDDEPPTKKTLAERLGF
jgi:hypothetical protein